MITPPQVLSELEREMQALLEQTSWSDAEKSAQAAWDQLIEVYWDDKRWDSEFTMSPYNPFGEESRVAAHGAAALRVVVPLLATNERGYRVHALGVLGDIGSAARPALPRVLVLARGDDDYERAIAVRAACGIDLDVVCALGLDRDRRTRLAVMEWIVRHRPLAEQRAHIERLLDGDAGLQRFALLGGGASLAFKGLHEHPDLIPVERVSALLDSPDRDVAAAAQRTLLHAGVRIDGARSVPSSMYELEMIAPLASSDTLVERLIALRHTNMLVELARRHRQAGRAFPLARFCDFLTRELAARARGTEREVGAAIELLAELVGCEALRAEVEAAAREHAEHLTIFMTDAARRYAVALHAVRTGLGLDDADRLFTEGELWTSYGGADKLYDHVLLEHPGTAHAAFQLAWIARGYGVEIDRERMAWIASLGFRDRDLLDALAHPVAGLSRATMMWSWSTARGDRDKAAERATLAERAGLWGLAARQLDDGKRKAELLARTRDHLAQVRAACQPAGESGRSIIE